MNNTYQMTGEATVIISSPIAQTLNGKVYEANEPILRVKDTFIVLDYAEDIRTIGAGRNLASVVKVYPETFTITSVDIKTGILNLIAKEENNQTTFVPHYKEGLADENGEIFTKYSINNVASYFVYNKDGDKVVCTINENKISGLIPDEKYLIYYHSERDNKGSYTMNENIVGYLKIEAILHGNINGSAGNMLITIPKASLSSMVSLDSTQGTMGQSLTFTVIGKETKVEYYG